MQSSLCAVRNTILENLSSLPLKQREKASILGISQQMISYLLQKTHFQFLVGAKNEKDLQDLKIVEKNITVWLKDAFTNHGIGAKTAVGYGYMQETK